jgi:hypothetical protein
MCTWKVHLSRSTLGKPVKEKNPVYKLKRHGWEVGTHPRDVTGKLKLENTIPEIT